jgi:hypothetical protein
VLESVCFEFEIDSWKGINHWVLKPTALLSFSNVNKGRKKINKCKDLKINDI